MISTARSYRRQFATRPARRYEPTAYRINVFCQSTTIIGKGKRQRTKTTSYGYCGWNPEQHYQEARLPGAGSFLYPGLAAVRKAAMAALALPETHQVVIKTNQDQDVYRYFKAADGTITGYGTRD